MEYCLYIYTLIYLFIDMLAPCGTSIDRLFRLGVGASWLQHCKFALISLVGTHTHDPPRRVRASIGLHGLTCMIQTVQALRGHSSGFKAPSD